METSKINVCVDKDTKQEAEMLFNELGLTMSAAINIFLKKVLMEQGLPFKVTKESNPKASLYRAMEEVKDMEQNPGNYKSYSTFGELLSDSGINV